MAKFYQVGGSVRDAILGVKTKDVDYAVEAESYDDMVNAVVQRGCKIHKEDEKFLRILAKDPVLGDVDFVLCRKDGNYSDGRRPDSVEQATILEDLARRDFTMNAIAVDEAGVLIDPFDGQGDIEMKLIRTVGNAEDRFQEDGLRLLRALRFSVTKGFALDRSIRMCLHDPEFFTPCLKNVSVERVHQEFMKMFRCDTFQTIQRLEWYNNLSGYLFRETKLWLKPTLEAR
jgi:tRNA nucleotidyltransferase (CCA-adding enzyme)